jgi:DNA-binding CsgD family transcriptional regulator
MRRLRSPRLDVTTAPPESSAGNPRQEPAPTELFPTFNLGGRRLAVVSFPLMRSAGGPWGLTQAEYGVARMALDGLGNLEIASHRGVAVRTVANQMASIFRKLGVRSRGEMQAVLAGSTSKK